jgi:hypothetical protein
MSKNFKEASGAQGTAKGRQSNSTSTQRVDGAKGKNPDNAGDLAGAGQAFDGQRQSAQARQIKQLYSQKHVQSSPHIPAAKYSAHTDLPSRNNIAKLAGTVENAGQAAANQLQAGNNTAKLH